jgi:hypothetical protein
MFAPILIGSLMGWPGILAFAVPNILGCALFGYLRSADQSRRETRDHALAMSVFATATVAYQVFFAGWLWGPVLRDSLPTTLELGTTFASGAIFAGAVLLAAFPRHIVWTLAAIAYPLSLLTFAFLPWGDMHAIPAQGEWPAGGVLLVLPTVVFGFMLSPNLDLTFHRARQECAEGARPTNFAVFGIAFASMLILTCCYLASPGGLNNPAVRAHMALQLTLTSALQLSELRIAAIRPNTRLVLGVAAGSIGLLAALAAAAELIVGRETYLRFLGLYGLAFPAYAALALRSGARPRLPALFALAIAVLAVTPLLDRSFTDVPSLATPLAVVIPLLAVALFGRRR